MVQSASQNQSPNTSSTTLSGIVGRRSSFLSFLKGNSPKSSPKSSPDRSSQSRRGSSISHVPGRKQEDKDQIKPFSQKNQLWKKLRFYFSDYKFLVPAAVASAIGSIFFPPLIFVSAGFAFSAGALYQANKIKDADIDKNIKRYKRRTIFLGITFVGLAAGSFVFPPLVIPALMCGFATAASAGVFARLGERKDGMFRDNIHDISLSSQTAFQKQQSISGKFQKGRQNESDYFQRAARAYKSRKRKGIFKKTSQNLEQVAAQTASFGSALEVETNAFNLGNALGSFAPAAEVLTAVGEPTTIVAATLAAGYYTRYIDKTGTDNMDNAGIWLRRQYREIDYERYRLVKEIVNGSFSKKDSTSKIDGWVETYLYRGIFESNASNEDLRVKGKTIQSSISAIVAQLGDGDKTNSLEQIDDWKDFNAKDKGVDRPSFLDRAASKISKTKAVRKWEKNVGKIKYTTSSKLNVLSALPVFKMMVTDNVNQVVNGEGSYNEILEGIFNKITEKESVGEKIPVNEKTKMDYKIKASGTDRKLSFGFHLRQLIERLYNENLVFGSEFADEITIVMIRDNLKPFLEYAHKNPKDNEKLQDNEILQAIPSKSRILDAIKKEREEHSEELSEKEIKRLEKLSFDNPFFLAQITNRVFEKSMQDRDILLEVALNHQLADKFSMEIKYAEKHKQYDVTPQTGRSYTSNLKGFEKLVEEMSIDESFMPYRGLGIDLSLEKKDNQNYVLQIKEIFSSDFRRFKEYDSSLDYIDNADLENKEITHIMSGDEMKAIGDFKKKNGDIDVEEIKKCFTGNEDVVFQTDEGKYVCEATDRNLFITKNYQNLDREREGNKSGERYNPFEHGISSQFKEMIVREKRKESNQQQSSQSDNSSSFPTESSSGNGTPTKTTPSPSPSSPNSPKSFGSVSKSNS